MTGKLFRPEVLERHARRLSGEVIIATPLSTSVLAWSAALVVVVLAIVLSTATYPRRETLQGWIVPDRGLARLPAREAGTVEAVYVQEGQAITSGTPIARIRFSSVIRQGDAQAVLTESLVAQREAAQAQAAADKEGLLQERSRLGDRRALLRRQLDATEHRLELQQERLRIARADVARAEQGVRREVLPRQQLEARQSTALAVEQEASSLETAALAVRAELAEIDSRLRGLPNSIDAVAARAASVQADLQQRSTQGEIASEQIVIATVAGRVGVLPVVAGQTVERGATVAIVTPSASRLLADLYAPTRSAGFLKAGQSVRLRYDAFPYQKFGSGSGRITAVSRAVLSPADVASSGIKLSEPVYRVRVTLAEAHVRAYGQVFPLQPGMLLTSDVVIDRRSLVEWILEPIFAARRR